MKKNGFIATSLIYSFFLIFITLFLTIITEGLQQKLLLNEIEKGIKDEINSSMGIKDFKVGDVIYDPNKLITPDNKIWIVAKIETDDNDPNNNNLYLYSYETYDSITTGEEMLTLDAVKNDLQYGGVYNNTYLNKLVYDFSGTEFNLGNIKIEKTNICLNIENDEMNTEQCSESTQQKYRKRYKKNIGKIKYKRNIAQDSGSITIEGEVQ